MQLHTYLNYGGNCEAAFRFYEEHLGGKILMLMKHGEAPGGGAAAPGWKDKVLHARLALGGTVVLGADIPPDRFQPMRSAYLSLTVNSTSEAERTYALLTEGGQIFMPIALFTALRHVPRPVRHVVDADDGDAAERIAVVSSACSERLVCFGLTLARPPAAVCRAC